MLSWLDTDGSCVDGEEGMEWNVYVRYKESVLNK